MRTRPLDESGDFVPVYSLDQMVSGGEAVKQVVDYRLRFYYGEWWEDPEIGFRIPDFLAENARSGGLDMLTKYINTYISSTEGVQEIEDSVSQFSDHVLTYSCIILADDGQEETVEVSADGLL